MKRSIHISPGRPSFAPAVVEYSVEHGSDIDAHLEVKPIGERLITVENLLGIPVIEMLLPGNLPPVRNLFGRLAGRGGASRVVFRSALR